MGSLRLLLLLLPLIALFACGGGGGDDDDGGGSGNPGGGQPPGNNPGVDFPLRASANNRLLEDQSGDPFLLHGDTAWTAEVRLTTAQMEQYLDDREQRGFNAILIEAIEHFFNSPCTVDVNCWFNASGEAPFTQMNPTLFSSPNTDYWDQIDIFFDLAKDRGMVVLVTPAYIGVNCNNEGWADRMIAAGDAEMRAYGEFLGQRYQDQDNLIWVHGGDSHPDDFACDAALESRIDALEAGIAAFDPDTLRTAHDDRGRSARDRYGDRPWLTLNTTYSACFAQPGSENVPNGNASALQIMEDYDNSTTPFIYFEGRYENEGGADLQCLISQAYWAVLGGAAGQIFGNNPIWLFETGWENALDSAGAQAMTALRRLMDSRPWFDLVPDYNEAIVSGDRGDLTDSDFVAAASTANGELLMIYAPEANNQIDVDLTQLSGSDVRVWRFDPTDGSSVLDGTYPTSAARTFTTSGLEILVFDDDALGLSAPGS